MMMQPDPNRSREQPRSGDGPERRPTPNAQRRNVEPAGPAPTARVTFGEELRRERELRQIGLSEVAEATKINRRYLEALERNDFSYLPGGLFNRSFVRAYCQTIGIDAEAMVNAYLLEEQSQSSNGAAFDPELLRGDPAARATVQRGPAGRERRSSPIVWWALALFVIVVAVALLAYFRLFATDGESEAASAARPAVDAGPSRTAVPRGTARESYSAATRQEAGRVRGEFRT